MGAIFRGRLEPAASADQHRNVVRTRVGGREIRPTIAVDVSGRHVERVAVHDVLGGARESRTGRARRK